jgi:hypothetical protein
MPRNMYVIVNSSGKVIAACAEHITSADGSVNAMISPSSPDHKMYLVHNIPDEVMAVAADKFQASITQHFHATLEKTHVADPKSLLRPRKRH